MKAIQKGFTLIELMMVAIIGILAAVALPAYQDYTIRARVSELIIAASAFRTAVTEKYQSDQDNTAAGVGLTVNPVGKINAGSVSALGVIILSGIKTTDPQTNVGTAVSVTLTPSFNPETAVWSCIGTPNRYLPGTCR